MWNGTDSSWALAKKITILENENPFKRNCWSQSTSAFEKGCFVVKLREIQNYEHTMSKDLVPTIRLIDTNGTFIYWRYNDLEKYTTGELKLRSLSGSHSFLFWPLKVINWTRE